jgi:AraC-like DNA-binding protein
LELVAAGNKVSCVALDVGYASVSAFIAMFRRQYGESPRQFLIENSERYLAVAQSQAALAAEESAAGAPG